MIVQLPQAASCSLQGLRVERVESVPACIQKIREEEGEREREKQAMSGRRAKGEEE